MGTGTVVLAAGGCIEPHCLPISMDNTAEFDTASVVTDADRLDVYRVAREFDSFAARALPLRGSKVLGDQLERASSSIVLNIAEGAGRFARAEKAQFYRVARGSAMECMARLRPRLRPLPVQCRDLSKGSRIARPSDPDAHQARPLHARVTEAVPVPFPFPLPVRSTSPPR
jgi:hypothetical protein